MTPVAPPMPTPICGAIINQCTVCQYSKIDPSTVECIACQKNFGLVNNQCKSCPRQCKQGCRVSTKIRLPTFECIWRQYHSIYLPKFIRNFSIEIVNIRVIFEFDLLVKVTNLISISFFIWKYLLCII